MENFPSNILGEIICYLDNCSIASLASTCSKFSSAWESIFHNLNDSLYQKIQYFSEINKDLNKLPPWYSSNKSYLGLVLFVKEMQKRNATFPMKVNFEPPYTFFSTLNEYKKSYITQFYLYTIGPFGDFMEIFVYYESYENTDFWIVLKNLNGKSLFLPLSYFKYQHGYGWDVWVATNPVQTCANILGINCKTRKFIKDLIDAFPFDYLKYDFGGPLELLKEKNVKIAIEKQTTHSQVENLREVVCGYWPTYIEEHCDRTFERKQLIRSEEQRKKKRGPVSEEELVVWELLLYKADRGHDWKIEQEQAKLFPEDHLRYLVNNVRSDLGRTLLWCCAARDWKEEAEWAMCFGADPMAEAGKGSAFEIAAHCKRSRVLDLFQSSLSFGSAK